MRRYESRKYDNSNCRLKKVEDKIKEAIEITESECRKKVLEVIDRKHKESCDELDPKLCYCCKLIVKIKSTLEREVFNLVKK